MYFLFESFSDVVCNDDIAASFVSIWMCMGVLMLTAPPPSLIETLSDESLLDSHYPALSPTFVPNIHAELLKGVLSVLVQ